MLGASCNVLKRSHAQNRLESVVTMKLIGIKKGVLCIKVLSNLMQSVTHFAIQNYDSRAFCCCDYSISIMILN